MKVILMLFLVFPFFAIAVKCQQSSAMQPETIATCENVQHALDLTVYEGNRLPINSFIVLIFRQAKSETIKAADLRMQFWQRYMRMRRMIPEKFVFATAKPASKLGRLSVFIDGEERWQFSFRPNRKGLGTCIK